jgi:hypothetical protein
MPEKTGSLPQNSRNEKMVDPKAHHKCMRNSPLNAENPQLSDGTIFISVGNLFRECMQIYCSGVSYP